MPGPVRIAVIGAGTFGRNHLRVLHDLSAQPVPSNLNPSYLSPEHHPALTQSGLSLDATPATKPTLPAVQLAALVDSNPNTRAEAATRYNIPALASVDDLLAADLRLHAATVCVPTLAHRPVASQLLAAGLDVLVEKPLAANLAEADELLALAAREHRILAAGHLERFNPAVTAALSCLTRPMFYEAHRLSVFTPRSLDVDVVLDLMIHDLDILLTMAQSSVCEVRAVGLPVLSRQVDIANVRLEFTSGAVANLTASRVSTEQVRKLRLFQPMQYLSLDYARQELLTINVDAGTTGMPALAFEKQDLPKAEPLRLELENFIGAVANRTPPRVTGQAARAALALALEINQAMRAHTQKAGLAADLLTPRPLKPQT